MFDADALRKARRRGGEASEDRPAKVDEALGPRETVGFKEGLPLLDKEYGDYFQNDSLLLPQARDDLVSLVDHELIGSVKDVARELGSREDKVSRALELHGADDPSGFDVQVNTDRLHALIGDVPDRFVTTESPVLVAHLYVSVGLSVTEIADVLSETMDDHKTVAEAAVRQCLVDARILEGQTSAEAKRYREQTRGELNRPDTRGLSINAGDH